MLHIDIGLFLSVFDHSCQFYEIIKPFALYTTNISCLICKMMLDCILSISVLDKFLRAPLILPDFLDDTFRAFIFKIVDTDHCYVANRPILNPLISLDAKYQISLFGEIFSPFIDCEDSRTRNFIIFFGFAFPFNEDRGIDFTEMLDHILFLEQELRRPGSWRWSRGLAGGALI